MDFYKVCYTVNGNDYLSVTLKAHSMYEATRKAKRITAERHHGDNVEIYNIVLDN